MILAYERVHSLFQVMERLGSVPSLAKILIVWNNQVKPPPPGKFQNSSVSVSYLQVVFFRKFVAEDLKTIQSDSDEWEQNVQSILSLRRNPH